MGESAPVIVPPGESVTLDIPVNGIDPDSLIEYLQLVIDGPIGDLEIILTPPAGTPMTVMDQPGTTAEEMHVLILPGTAPGGLISTVTGSVPVDGIFQADDNLQAQVLPPNGVWQLQIINHGGVQAQVQEVLAAFGQLQLNADEIAQFQIDAPNPAAGVQDVQLQVDVFPDAFMLQVDWGDGNVQFRQLQVNPALPLADQLQVDLSHTYSGFGGFTIAVTIYDRGGAFYQRTDGVSISPPVGTTCAAATVLAMSTTYNLTGPVAGGVEHWWKFVSGAGTFTLTTTGVGGNLQIEMLRGANCGSLASSGLSDGSDTLLMSTPLWLKVTDATGSGAAYSVRFAP
jgi:hypothetical protein